MTDQIQAALDANRRAGNRRAYNAILAGLARAAFPTRDAYGMPLAKAPGEWDAAAFRPAARRALARYERRRRNLAALKSAHA